VGGALPWPSTGVVEADRQQRRLGRLAATPTDPWVRPWSVAGCGRRAVLFDRCQTALVGLLDLLQRRSRASFLARLILLLLGARFCLWLGLCLPRARRLRAGALREPG
jgi:hypothetical protein